MLLNIVFCVHYSMMYKITLRCPIHRITTGHYIVLSFMLLGPAVLDV